MPHVVSVKLEAVDITLFNFLYFIIFIFIFLRNSSIFASLSTLKVSFLAAIPLLHVGSARSALVQCRIRETKGELEMLYEAMLRTLSRLHTARETASE